MANSSAIKDFIEYWDNWHREWFTNSLTTPPNLAPIKEWITPTDKGGNESPMWQYFPEPYWGNPFSKVISAIFLNINPAGGGVLQDILTFNQEDSYLYKTYNKNNKIYSKTVAELSANPKYKTTEWMLKWRINWLRDILDDKNKSINVADVLCVDLIPWHTKKKSDVKNYAVKSNNPSNINSHVIRYLSAIAQSKSVREEMRGKVIVRSSMILDVINEFYKKNPNSISVTEIENFVIVEKQENLLSKFNSYLTILKMNQTVYYVFSGGSNSALPNPKYTVLPVGQIKTYLKKDISLKEFMRSKILK